MSQIWTCIEYLIPTNIILLFFHTQIWWKHSSTVSMISVYTISDNSSVAYCLGDSVDEKNIVLLIVFNKMLGQFNERYLNLSNT